MKDAEEGARDAGEEGGGTVDDSAAVHCSEADCEYPGRRQTSAEIGKAVGRGAPDPAPVGLLRGSEFYRRWLLATAAGRPPGFAPTQWNDLQTHEQNEWKLLADIAASFTSIAPVLSPGPLRAAAFGVVARWHAYIESDCANSEYREFTAEMANLEAELERSLARTAAPEGREGSAGTVAGEGNRSPVPGQGLPQFKEKSGGTD